LGAFYLAVGVFLVVITAHVGSPDDEPSSLERAVFAFGWLFFLSYDWWRERRQRREP
jgi:hypothetical protein